MSSLTTDEGISGKKREEFDSDRLVDNPSENESEDDFLSSSDWDMMNHVDGVIFLKRGSTEDQARSRFDQGSIPLIG